MDESARHHLTELIKDLNAADEACISGNLLATQVQLGHARIHADLLANIIAGQDTLPAADWDAS